VVPRTLPRRTNCCNNEEGNKSHAENNIFRLKTHCLLPKYQPNKAVANAKGEAKAKEELEQHQDEAGGLFMQRTAPDQRQIDQGHIGAMCPRCT
jgi:hypothetical protein